MPVAQLIESKLFCLNSDMKRVRFMDHLNYALQNTWQRQSHLESPIDLKVKEAHFFPWPDQPLKLSFGTSRKVIKSTQENGDQFKAEGTLSLGEHKFTLQRLHFHDGSEHTINGQWLDGEIHLVYQDKLGANLVLAILCQVKPSADELLPLACIYQEQANICKLATLLPQNLSYATYTGSLTTPPLKGGITWVVLLSPHPISQASKRALHTDYPNNHRQIQPLNGRKVLYYQTSK